MTSSYLTDRVTLGAWQRRLERHTPKTAAIGCFAILVLVLICDLPMAVQQQISLFLTALALVLWRIKGQEQIRLALLVLSAASSVRYIIWRFTHTLNLSDPLNGLASLSLFAAELYVGLILVATFFQVLNLDHSIESTPPDPHFQPTVDIFITTYDESASILRRTIAGTKSITYLNKKIHVLDDGKREEIRALAEEMGVNYITRAHNLHAKAGNINNALQCTNGEFVVIFDADHVPVESFLSCTMQYFKDHKVALLQTPHRFINPGPMERNLHLDGQLPQEQELFYQLVQVGNNHWNSAFFCGSAAILRRSALERVGGMAVETVTEDCHTAMKMHTLGYKSIYLSKPLSAGLSPESFKGYVIQRSRWAKGMVQILRQDNPLFCPGLTLSQRLCYISSMSHFLFGLPRLIFFTMPLAYLLFNLHPLQGLPGNVVIMALPHIAIATLANNYHYKNFRHSFWSEVYETVLSPYLAYITTLAFIKPDIGKFNVTPKGGLIQKPFFDLSMAWPLILILVISAICIALCPLRYMQSRDLVEQQSVLINVFWAIHNFVLIMAGIWIALERTQRRKVHRIPQIVSAAINIPELVATLLGSTEDLNEMGTLVRIKPTENMPQLTPGQKISLSLTNKAVTVPDLIAYVRRVQRTADGEVHVGLEFSADDTNQFDSLIRLAYCEKDSWSHFREPADSILQSYWNILTTAPRVLWCTWGWSRS